MKRDQSEDGKPSSATPGEPPPAETPEAPPVFPPAEPDVIPSAESKEVPVPPLSEELREGLEPSAGKGRRPPPFEGSTLVRLGKGIEIPIERLDQYALALAAQYPDKDWVEEIIPLACQRLGQMSEFLSRIHPIELEFMAMHGRRWKLGDGISLKADILVFDPAQPAESARVFRARLKGTLLPHGDPALIRRIWECHEIYLERREELGQGKRFPPFGKPGGVADTFYPGFEGPCFIGKEIEGLKRYMNIRFPKARSAQRAKQLFLAGAKK